ncbi:MAG TPA: Rossmann-like and DUF2520 domain-containing protein [Chitinophagaceae bacterium]|nr:Rossmann-like and DUF2520 domain-containing protein [Chitinophagaceae bacterium]
MKVVILGSGNVGTVLCELITKSDNELVQVVSRNPDHARALASRYNTQAGALTDGQFAGGDIYIVALIDAALDSIEKVAALKNKFVVHTAGSAPMSVLKGLSSAYGVLYPLQSLSKSLDELPEIPFLVEGNNKETQHRITEFARSLSDNVINVTEHERMFYHIAAVFAANFTNHMYAIAEEICRKEKIDFKVLLPIINEVSSRVESISPYDLQTGPAIRDDILTLNKHIQALSAFPDVKYLYLKLSESILKFYQKR